VIPFTITSKQLKPMKKSKKVTDFYNENYKTLKKEIEEDTQKWKDFPYLWICRNNIMKMAIY
jgi:hypothetical protein